MRGHLCSLTLLAARSTEQGIVEVLVGSSPWSAATRWDWCSNCSTSGPSTSTSSTAESSTTSGSEGPSNSSRSSNSLSIPQWPSMLQITRGMAMANRHQVEEPRSKEARGVKTRHIKSDPYRTPPQNFVQLLIHIKQAKTITYLEKLLREYEAQFDAVHVAAAITKLPRLVRRNPDPDVLVPEGLLARGRAALAKLQAMVPAFIPVLYPRQISNIIWALGQMKHLRNKESYELVTQLLDALQDQQYTRLFMHGNQLDIANLCSGLAQLGYSNPRFMTKLAAVTQRRIEHFQVRQVAQVAWGYAKLGLYHPELMDTLAEHAAQNVNFFNPQGMTNTLWAFASLQHRNEKLLTAFTEAAGVQMHRFKSLDLSVTSWALSRLGHYSPELFSKMEERAVECLSYFTPMGLSMLLQGFAKVGHACPTLMDASSEALVKEPHIRAQPDQIAGLAWAYATLRHQNEKSELLFQKLSQVGQQLMPLSKPPQLRTLLTSSHQLGYLDPQLVQSTAQHLLDNFTSNWKLRDTTSLLSDFLVMGHKDDNIFTQVANGLSEAPELLVSDLGAAVDILQLYVKASMPCKGLVEAVVKLISQPPSESQEALAASTSAIPDSASESAGVEETKAERTPAGSDGSQEEPAPTTGVKPSTASEMKLRKLAGLLYCCSKAEVDVPPILLQAVAGKLAAGEGAHLGLGDVSKLLQGLAGVREEGRGDIPWAAFWTIVEPQVAGLSQRPDKSALVASVGKLPQAPASLIAGLS